VVDSTGGRYIQVVAKAGLTVVVQKVRYVDMRDCPDWTKRPQGLQRPNYYTILLYYTILFQWH
jgi:hypothetical protein